MSLILDEAKERLTEAADSAKLLQEERRERMRDDIGRETYESAKTALPVMEKFIQGTLVPWRNNIESIAQTGARLTPPKRLGVAVFMFTEPGDRPSFSPP